MVFFVILILFVAYVQTIIKLSLLDRLYRWGFILLFTLPLLCFYEEAAKINLRFLDSLVSDFNTLSLICILAIVQEVLVLIFGSILLRRYYLGRKLHFWYYAVLLPSGLFPLLCFLAMVYIFNIVGEVGFRATAFYLIAGIIAVTGSTVELINFFRPNYRESMTGLLALVSLVQIFLAMFLPVVLGGGIIKGRLINFNIDMLWVWSAILGLVVVFMFLAYSGIWQKLSAISKKLIGFH